MGRHSLPDEHGEDTPDPRYDEDTADPADSHYDEATPGPRYDEATPDPRPRARRRTVVITTALVLTVAAGSTGAVRGGLLSFGPSCRDAAVHLTVDSSPDLAPALRTAARQARATNVTSDGHCLDIDVKAVDSYKVVDSLRSGKKPDAQVWVPDSAVWLQRVNSGSADTAAIDSTQVTQAGNVASTPIGIAMVPSAAKSLGWPTKTYTWSQLAATTMQNDALRLGAADPSRSATGLLALTQLSTTVAKSAAGATQAAALTKTLSERASDSDGQVLDTLPRDASGTELGNPKRNEAVILSEQAAYTYNGSADDGDALDLFYPKDGSPALDYPYTLVDESELSTDESRAALRFMTYLGQAPGRKLLQRDGFRVEDANPPAALVSRAGGRSPQPYDKAALEPASDEAVQAALGTWTITVQSARITTVVDASGSMAEKVPGTDQSRMEVTKASLLQALSTFTAEDEIGLWEFSTKLDGAKDYRVLVPTERLGDRVAGTTQRARLSAAFNGLEPVAGGATGLYDTTLAAYQEAVSSYSAGKFNALVVLTDGVNEDPGSISRSSLIQRLQTLTDPKRPVPLIVIAVGPQSDEETADQIARATGGSGYKVENPAQIQSVILKAIVETGSQ
ncbi:von Willebrand factor type A [Actinobacteria bacterium OK074]|nr:von Willebrand factor type A [Actinobacteria bacterium OK074]